MNFIKFDSVCVIYSNIQMEMESKSRVTGNW